VKRQSGEERSEAVFLESFPQARIEFILAGRFFDLTFTEGGRV